MRLADKQTNILIETQSAQGLEQYRITQLHILSWPV